MVKYLSIHLIAIQPIKNVPQNHSLFYPLEKDINDLP